MTILVIKGALLDGADDGVRYYLEGEQGFNITKMGNPELWSDAAGQVIQETLLIWISHC